ncbi:UNVERIFIED_CONTAM: hypothetical protein Sangu_1256600 [Sesamum angustifolium]|uniref:Suppressor of white apricot N-terminal domain-containing protein n=1 Tax=Sesamum angustifolium TaxID=2727405 RepID=A0AAW2NL09_9LAMI
MSNIGMKARRSERKVHDMMDAAREEAGLSGANILAKRRGEPRAAVDPGRWNPLPHPTVDGFSRLILMLASIVALTFVNLFMTIAVNERMQHMFHDTLNGKQDTSLSRQGFDGRALLDFIRDSSSRRFRVPEKTEEEEELEEFVNFERYRDLIKHRRRGCRWRLRSLQLLDRTDGEEEDEDEDEDEEDFNSDDSNDEAVESIAKEFGVKSYGWLVYMDKKAKEEARRQKEVIKGDPSIRKLSRKERRKASQMEREREREAARVTGTRVLHHDPYKVTSVSLLLVDSRRSPTYEAYSRSRRSRSRSRSYSPSQSRRYSRGMHSDDTYRSKDSGPKIEYITEFGGSGDGDEPKLEGYSPPQSPPSQADALNRPSSGRILEALHVDPASGVSLDKDKNTKLLKTTPRTQQLKSLKNENKSGRGSKSLQKQADISVEAGAEVTAALPEDTGGAEVQAGVGVQEDIIPDLAPGLALALALALVLLEDLVPHLGPTPVLSHTLAHALLGKATSCIVKHPNYLHPINLALVTFTGEQEGQGIEK